jgi:hypothetical protein
MISDLLDPEGECFLAASGKSTRRKSGWERKRRLPRSRALPRIALSAHVMHVLRPDCL